MIQQWEGKYNNPLTQQKHVIILKKKQIIAGWFYCSIVVMTAIEERLSSCTFSDALYVTADEGRDGVISSTELTASDDGANNQHEINRKSRFTSSTSNVITDTSTEYFSAQTHQTYTSPFSSADDSGSVSYTHLTLPTILLV